MREMWSYMYVCITAHVVCCSEKSAEVFLLMFLGMLKADSYNANLLSRKVCTQHTQTQ